MRKYKLIKMFDVDKLYTYHYCTKEVYENADRFKKIVDELKILNSAEAIAEREQFSDILDFINENDLDPKVNEQLQQKLYDIQEDHIIIKELIAELKEIKGKTRIVRDESKSLYNDILDLHLAVFDNNNQELYKLILSPNGFGKLKVTKNTGLAFEIDDIKTRAGKPDYNFLSTQYQMMKFFNGTSGKSGVSIFSSLSMLNAISQGKGMRYVDTSIVDGVMFDNFNIKFGNLKSDGKIGELKTLDGGSYISKVIEAFQSASVDNEKEQILYKLNINRHTFNTINALAMLGFDERVICYFINQPIIEEYVKRMADKDSSLNKFTESLTGDIFGDIIKEYSDKYSIDPDYSATDYGVDDLKKELEVLSSNRDGSYWAKQLAILTKFKYINEVGRNLQSVMQTVNAESKGLGKTLFGSIDRENKIDNIDDVSIKYGKKSTTGLLGAEKILYEVDNSGKIVLENNVRKSNSLNGFVAEYGTSELNKIGRQLLPYDNIVVKSLFDYLDSILQRKGNSINANEEFMSQTFTAMKSYMFSNTKLFGEEFDISKERERLFFGTYKEISDGKIEVDEPSLPDIIDAIKSIEGGIGDTNVLLRSLIPDLRMKSSELKLIKYTASAGQNLDESELHQAFISLFREDIPIEFKIGDKIHTIQSRKLAEDLIKYVYLSGGTQEAIQFTRYIPIEVLNYMGFSDVLKDMAKKFDSETFGIELIDGVIENANVIEQIIQHNPKKVPVKIKGKLTANKADNFASGLKNVKSIKLSNGLEVITEFELALDAKDEKNNTGHYLVGQKYLSGRAGDKWMLYKFNGQSYESIPVLGTFGVNEYNYNLEPGEIAQSIIKDRNLIDNKSIGNKFDDSIIVKEDSKSIFSKYKLDELNPWDNHIGVILESIVRNGNDTHSEIARELLKNSHLLNSMLGVVAKYGKIDAKGSYSNSDRILTINNDSNAFRDKDHLEETFLHEIIHSYTIGTIRSDKESLPSNVLIALNKLDTLRRSLIYKAKSVDPEFSRKLNDVKKYKTVDSVALKPEHILAYGLNSLEEFVTMATTNVAFRNEFNQLNENFPQEGSLLQKLWNHLLEFLGLNNLSQINKDYVSNEIFQFVNEINKSLDKTIKPEVIEGFKDNEKYRKVQEALDSIERGEQEEIPVEVSTKEVEIPGFQESIDLSLSKEELKLLEAKHGENALNDYNQLSDEEKEYIIKCLR